MTLNSLLLPLVILAPLVAAGAVCVLPARLAWRAALWGTLAAALLAGFAMAVFEWATFLRSRRIWTWDSSARVQLDGSVPLVPELGLNLSVGVDSISLLLVGLTVLLGPICVLCSVTAITTRVKTFYAWMLVLQAAMTGVFCARDLILFYVCFEFTLVPMWVLIHLYGSTNRARAATKFFLYTFTGSLVALAGLVYVAWHASQRFHHWTFDIAQLTFAATTLTPREQGWIMLALLAGFAVKVPLFPLHTWLPLAHTEAPTAGSVVLAGVLLKLGTYGIYRFVLPMTSAAVVEHAPLIATLCIVGILYGGLVCWVQTDVKRLVAYSSVAHMGFCVLGMFALNSTGLTGSILYMLNHGLSTAALFLLIGMVYERFHTRDMRSMGGLAARMPVWSTFLVFFALASVGLPGLNGFIGEFLCLLGTFQAGSALAGEPGATPGVLARLGPWYALAAGLGVIIAAIYLLYMVGRMCFGALVTPDAHHGPAEGEKGHGALPADLCPREIGLLMPLAVLCLALGLYPRPVMKSLERPVLDTITMIQNRAEGLNPIEPGAGRRVAPPAAEDGGGP